MIGFNPNQVYNLEDLAFYLPKDRDITPVLLLKDSFGNYDILKLSKNGMDKNYIIYSISINNNIGIGNKNIYLSLLTLEKDIFKTSSATQVNFNFDNFTAAKRAFLLSDISRSLAETYQKIEELTKMNIEIYQSIEEATK